MAANKTKTKQQKRKENACKAFRVEDKGKTVGAIVNVVVERAHKRTDYIKLVRFCSVKLLRKRCFQLVF